MFYSTIASTAATLCLNFSQNLYLAIKLELWCAFVLCRWFVSEHVAALVIFLSIGILVLAGGYKDDVVILSSPCCTSHVIGREHDVLEVLPGRAENHDLRSISRVPVLGYANPPDDFQRLRSTSCPVC